jgi:hypothetical protein
VIDGKVTKIWHDAFQMTKPPQMADLKNRATWIYDESKYEEWLAFIATMEAYDEEEEEKKKELKDVKEKKGKAKSDAGTSEESTWIEFPSTEAKKENTTTEP